VRRAVPGVLGVPHRAPYDRILVSAEATELPSELVDQLVPDGRMVVPVRGRMTLVVAGPEEIRTSHHGSYRFVPLVTTR
jgi:protein-L-isoaspartate(D-aspartate) O-methyltransferase